MGEVINMEVGDHVSVAGTSLVGKVKTTYDELEAVFGPPTYKGGDKTTAEWNIEFLVRDDDDDYDEEYIVASIYDWKMQDTPFGPYDWHVGGARNNDAVWYVQDMLDAHRKGQ
jgi:hypothetical protein